MVIIVKFKINVKYPQNRDAILDDLKQAYSKEIYDSFKANDDSKLFFIWMKFKSKDAIEIVKKVDEIFKHSDKIDDVFPMPSEKFGRDNLIPMLISSGISLAAIATIVYGYKIPLNEITDYVFVLGLPTIVGFFTEYLHKYT